MQIQIFFANSEQNFENAVYHSIIGKLTGLNQNVSENSSLDYSQNFGTFWISPIESLQCCKPYINVGGGFGHFGSRHLLLLSFNISFGHQYSKDVTNITVFPQMTPANDFTKSIISHKIKIAILDFSKMIFPEISECVQK